MSEEEVLLAIHGWSQPWLDTAFRASHELGTGTFCLGLVTVAALIAALRKHREEAVLWIVLGVSTWLLQKGIKVAVARPRPALWDGPVYLTSYAFPSGHAVAAATFYPLIARAVAMRWPSVRTAAFGCAVTVAAYIGIGRLYLGVHWPTDVLAGWTLGALQTYAAVRYLHQRKHPSAT